jgi:16S rRNA (guanine(527)-N(7))-methyltransferase RsmG
MKSSEGLKRLIREFSIPEDNPYAHQLLDFLALLEKWNARINLTASTEWQRIEPLFREGIWASRIYPINAKTHLDIGTGAGFPAIILKMMNPHIQLEMVESRSKKGAFLETVIHALGLNGSIVHANRLDSFLQRIEHDKTWDCITWKALKLNNSDLLQLQKHAHSATQVWMFHGKEPAVEDPERIKQQFTLFRSEKLPAMKEGFLSIYLSRQ